MDRFDEVYIESKKLYEVKMEYIHTNPLQEKWSLVAKPEDYIYSSARYYEIGLEDDLVEDYFDYF